MQAVIKVYPYVLGGGGGGGGFPSQGYIFLSKSLAEGVFFLKKTPKNWHFGAILSAIFFLIFSSQGNIWAKIP